MQNNGIYGDTIRKCSKFGKVIRRAVGQELKVQLKEMELTFEKAKSDLAQDVQFIVRALTVNTSDMLKDKLRSTLKQCENQPT